MARRSVIADTSGIIALLDQDDHYHQAVVQVFEHFSVMIPTTVLPEVDYLVTKYLGEQVVRAFIDDITAGYFTYLSVDLEDLANARQVMEQYRGFPLGLVDASLVVLAERYQIRRILTLDRRHFNAIQPKSIDYLELLP